MRPSYCETVQSGEMNTQRLVLPTSVKNVFQTFIKVQNLCYNSHLDNISRKNSCCITSHKEGTLVSKFVKQFFNLKFKQRIEDMDLYISDLPNIADKKNIFFYQGFK